MQPNALFVYCVTCQCLTPIGDLSEITRATGIHTEIISADSEQQAHRISKEGIAERFRDQGTVKISGDAVGILDANGHIVNYFWGFRSHRI